MDSKNYDGLILDIMMPKLDGISVLKKIRSEGNSIPVLMLTAKSEIDDKVLGLDCGANDYLTKPFNTKELLARIRAMRRRKSEQMDSKVKFGNVVLDRSTFELSSLYGNFRLANKEFQMMEMMMMNLHNVISADHFLGKVWGYDSDVEIMWCGCIFLI